MNSINNGRRHKAFTLIELLVVVGIIAIIAAILFPVFAGIRERGRRTQCLSNERQLGIAVLQYAGDNNETFYSTPFTPLPGVGWAGGCLPYMKNATILACPSDSKTPGNDPYEKVVSYALNSNLSGNPIYPKYPKSHEATVAPAHSLSMLISPASTVLLFEVSDCLVNFSTTVCQDKVCIAAELMSPSGNGVGIFNGDSVGPTYPNCPSGGQFRVGEGVFARYATGNIGGRVLNGGTGNTPRHKEGANYLACDGHVRWLKPEAVSSGMGAAASSCLQGTEAKQPAGCIGQQKDQAAGTASGRYAMTFSSR